MLRVAQVCGSGRRLFWCASRLRLGSVSWGRLHTCLHNKRAYKMDGRTDWACSIFHVELLWVWSQRDVHVPELQYLSWVTVGTISGVLMEPVGVVTMSLAQKVKMVKETWQEAVQHFHGAFRESQHLLWMTTCLFQKFCIKTWIRTILNGNIVLSRLFWMVEDGQWLILWNHPSDKN